MQLLLSQNGDYLTGLLNFGILDKYIQEFGEVGINVGTGAIITCD